MFEGEGHCFGVHSIRKSDSTSSICAISNVSIHNGRDRNGLVGLATMLAFLGIGLGSMRQSKQEVSDYLLANRSVSPIWQGYLQWHPTILGLCSLAQLGLRTYGLSAFWLLFAWVLGIILGSLRRLREQSEVLNSQSVSGFISQWSRRSPTIRRSSVF